MKAIKKVEVTPLDYNFGKIIDSASTTDDKTKNTYSMKVIDDTYYTKNESDTKYFVKGNIAVVTGTTPWISIGGTLKNFYMTISFPEGFDYSNSIVIGAHYYYTPIPVAEYDDGGSWHTSFDIHLGQNINIHGISDNMGDDDAVCKVVLMKIN